MYRYELYNVDDIDKLKQELHAYKQTVRMTTEGKFFEDYLKTKDDFNDLKMKIFQLEGDMKTMEKNYQEEISDYELEMQNLMIQLTSIAESVQQLKQETQLMKHQFEQLPFVDLSEKINQLLSTQHTNAKEQKIELERIKGELLQVREWVKPKVDTAKNNLTVKKSEYRQLQGILQSPTNVEQSFNQKKNNQINKHYYSHTKTNTKKSYYTHPTERTESDTISNNKAKKVFRHPKYELNKNIITRTAAPKNKPKQVHVEENIPTDNTISTYENHTPAENNSMPIESNRMPSDNNSMINDNNSVHNDNNSMIHDGNNISNHNNSMFQDSNSIHNDNNSMFQDSNSIHNHNNSMFQDSNSIHNDNNSMIHDNNVEEEKIASSDVELEKSLENNSQFIKNQTDATESNSGHTEEQNKKSSFLSLFKRG
ncbi:MULTISPECIES: hypothetical protein [unclassified Virgibacillus]|uniref:hypothetical protein n=1 Tax=unclassified Virgibacillus TaxID=2620237 RepID=UPI000909B3DA|nr:MULTISPECIES: hypothetical protein [unclassified Virgibacillus]API92833.1 hypothetical protein BKP57_14055 [Virgibacillus sp. 6R]MBS7428342.1 hypothetical protein [Virgibacillus sp. 19R1-5]